MLHASHRLGRTQAAPARYLAPKPRGLGQECARALVPWGLRHRQNRSASARVASLERTGRRTCLTLLQLSILHTTHGPAHSRAPVFQAHPDRSRPLYRRPRPAGDAHVQWSDPLDTRGATRAWALEPRL